ncbi:MAG TPA: adenylate kinase [Epsilonproteobacteria bacterium]|nr:adenylate kinase [Campylobacterota bacterium]
MPKKLILLIGAPGSGKTTDARQIAEKHAGSITSYSTGDLIRKEIEKGTATGKIAEGFVSKGDLIPTAIVVEMIVAAIKSAPTDIVLLDGFPGKEKQLQHFCDFVFNGHDIQLVSVIEVRVSEEVAKARCLASGKSEEIFEHEMTSYTQAIDIIEKHYEDKQILKVIDGEKELDAVVAEIDAYLVSKL